jgi:hypothetical protein
MRAVAEGIIRPVLSRKVAAEDDTDAVAFVEEGFVRGVDAGIYDGDADACAVKADCVRAIDCADGIRAGRAGDVAGGLYAVVQREVCDFREGG